MNVCGWVLMHGAHTQARDLSVPPRETGAKAKHAGVETRANEARSESHRLVAVGKGAAEVANALVKRRPRKQRHHIIRIKLDRGVEVGQPLE